MSKPFQLFPVDKLPPRFQYPNDLIRIAMTGDYPEIYPWWFIDANSKAGELSYSNRLREGTNLIPFAKVDDDRNDIACFDGTDTSGNPKVVMRVLDDSGRSYSFENFDSWLTAAKADAGRWQT